MKRIAIGLALGTMGLTPLAALSEDAALVIVGNDYRYLSDVGGADAARELGQMLSATGFRVVTSIDEDSGDAARAMEDFRDLAEKAERVFVFVSGHVVSSAREAWLLGRLADAPTDMTIGAEAVPLGPLLDVAASRPGAAVVMVAPSGEAPAAEGLAEGMALAAPQGVTLVRGTLDELYKVAREVVLEPGRSLAEVSGDVVVTGFVSERIPFLPVSSGEALPPPPAVDRETSFWEVTKSMGDVAAFEAYLAKYPGGRYADLARAAIRELETRADAGAEATESALGLDRETRRSIQRDLSLLGYDPRGIDGIFGPGSRAAITAWQRANGHPQTGYLTAEQVRALADAAAIRAAALEREAAARKAEEERRDTAYWRETGRGADEAGLRAYLSRYPDGLYASIAEIRLGEIEEQKRAAAAAEERAFWDAVRAEDKADSYREYLRRYPKGAFAKEAQARLDALTADAGNAAAKAEEERVAGSGATRLLVENRLAAAGFDPGTIDGTFNRQTRRAIRQFQRAAGIEVSGYVTQATMVRLLVVR